MYTGGYTIDTYAQRHTHTERYRTCMHADTYRYADRQAQLQYTHVVRMSFRFKIIWIFKDVSGSFCDVTQFHV